MTQSDYYSVCLHSEAGDETYTVCATSDYAAARHVYALTGRMACSERDVQRLPCRMMPFPFLSAPEQTRPFSPSASGVFSVRGTPPRAGIA
ncbi:MAG: hypothetical protein ACK4PK_00450 [Alphaproteobacteria bacterium]